MAIAIRCAFDLAGTSNALSKSYPNMHSHPAPRKTRKLCCALRRVPVPFLPQQPLDQGKPHRTGHGAAPRRHELLGSPINRHSELRDRRIEGLQHVVTLWSEERPPAMM